MTKKNTVQDYLDHVKLELVPDKAMYIRFSTKEQENGWTEDFQREFCYELLKMKGWTVKDEMIFIDRGISGKNTKGRPQLQKLMALVESGRVNGIVSWRLDRMFRNAADALNIVQHKWEGVCKLVTQECEFDTESESGFLSLVVYAAFAEVERKKISSRTMAGKRKNAEFGLNPGSTVPYGYYVENERYFKDPTTAPIVERIFNTALTMGLTNIAKMFNGEGIPSPAGNKWVPQAVQYIVRNTFYCGYMTWGKKSINKRREKDPSQPYYVNNENYLHVAPGNIPPIVTQELFDEVQAAMSSRNLQKPNDGKRTITSQYLLTGIIQCRCGSTMKLSKYHCHDRDYRYYRCRDHVEMGVCEAGCTPMEEIDAYVLDHLDRLLLDDSTKGKILSALVGSNYADVDGKKVEVMEVEKQIAAINKRKQQIIQEHILNPKMSEENYQATLDACDTMAKDLTNQRNTAVDELASMTAKVEDTSHMAAYIEKYSQFKNLDIADKKKVLRELLDKVVVWSPGNGENREYDIYYRFPQID